MLFFSIFNTSNDKNTFTSNMLNSKNLALSYNGISSLTPYYSKMLKFFNIFLFLFLSLTLSCAVPFFSTTFLSLSLSLSDSWSPLQQRWATRRQGWRCHRRFSEGLVKGVVDVFPERGFHRQCHAGHETLREWLGWLRFARHFSPRVGCFDFVILVVLWVSCFDFGGCDLIRDLGLCCDSLICDSVVCDFGGCGS